jgi:hypothetical protein
MQKVNFAKKKEKEIKKTEEGNGNVKSDFGRNSVKNIR